MDHSLTHARCLGEAFPVSVGHRHHNGLWWRQSGERSVQRQVRRLAHMGSGRVIATHKRTHTYRPTQTHKHTHKHTHKQTHTTHTHTHTHTHTNTPMYIHKQTRICGNHQHMRVIEKYALVCRAAHSGADKGTRRRTTEGSEVAHTRTHTHTHTYVRVSGVSE
jgi:hypothetical protein